MKKDRIINYDLLRCIAAFCVVVIHVNSFFIYDASIYSNTFSILNVYTSLSRFSALVFFMISGSFLLDPDRELSNKKINNYIYKTIIGIFIINTLSIFYYYFFVNHYSGFDWIIISFRRFVSADVSSEQLWFLYEMILLYFLTPFLRKITQNSTKKELSRLIIFGIIFTVVLPTITSYPPFEEWAFSKYFTAEMGVSFSFSYIIYYLLGYYINKYLNKNDKKITTLIYILGIFGFAFTIFSGLFFSRYLHKLSLARAYYYFSLNVFLEAVSVFTFFKNLNINFGSKTKKIINFIASNSYGIYLLHVLLLSITINYVPKINPTILVPLYSIGLYIVSLLLSYLLKKIKFINKYILR